MKTTKIKIYGKVQSVNLRFMIYQKALELGLNGYVSNDPKDETLVHAVFQGDEKKINQITKFIKKSPGSSRVKKVEIEESDEEMIKGFRIKY